MRCQLASQSQEMALGYEKKKNYYSFPSVNHTPPPGNVEKKGESEKREGGNPGREGHMKKVEGS